MTRTTNPTTSSKWIRAPPICKLKPNSHKTSKTTKIVQSMLASRSPKQAEPDEALGLAHKRLHHGVSHFSNLKSGQKSSVWVSDTARIQIDHQMLNCSEILFLKVYDLIARKSVCRQNSRFTRQIDFCDACHNVFFLFD